MHSTRLFGLKDRGVCVVTLRALAVSPGDFAVLLVARGDFLCPLVATAGDLKSPILPARPSPVREFPEGMFSWHLRADV